MDDKKLIKTDEEIGYTSFDDVLSKAGDLGLVEGLAIGFDEEGAVNYIYSNEANVPDLLYSLEVARLQILEQSIRPHHLND